MSKEGAKIEKTVKKRKVSRYTVQECRAELARLDAVKDLSLYRDQVKERLAELEATPAKK